MPKYWEWIKFRAECLAIPEGVELAIKKGWVMLWVEADFGTGDQSFCNNSLCEDGDGETATMLEVSITSTLREANFSADGIAKAGVALQPNERIIYEGKPPWVLHWESPFQQFFRF
ncbi:hypothetical protein IFM89_035236 [Coptis chinensis]|uniref:Uncharacterized protein n=1 Tax=Coptis chinensis TaxID=261450 RepID=A0A835IIY0_9MAGN|nr:hypothetical protein IFM89_035236 [Coptis chinensis]